MDIRMIVTDLDGTLLHENKTVSLHTVSVLKKCREKGIKVAYATGRGASADTLTLPVIFDGRVYVNGALAYAGEEKVYSKLIPIALVRDMLIAAYDAGICIAAESGGRHYANFDPNETWPWVGEYVKTDFRQLDIEVEKVYALINRPEVLDLMQEYLPDGLYLCSARDHVAMVMHEEARKAKAVAALAAYWGIPCENVVAFGDDVNDLDLLEYCGWAVVMGNGMDEAKAVADELCRDNDEDGVAQWLVAKLGL